MLKSSLVAVMISLCVFTFAEGQDDKAKRRDQQRPQTNRQKMQQPQNQSRRDQRNQPSAKEVMNRLDKNGDGILSGEEVPARLQNRMKMLDKDNSGSISMSELINGMSQQRKGRFGSQMQQRQMQKGKKGQQGKRGESMGRGTRDGAQAAEFMFKRMDQNGDGIITKDEAPERMKARFAKMDKNGNDQLDQNEIVAVLEIMKAEGGKKGGRYNTDPSKTRPVEPKRPPRK